MMSHVFLVRLITPTTSDKYLAMANPSKTAHLNGILHRTEENRTLVEPWSIDDDGQANHPPFPDLGNEAGDLARGQARALHALSSRRKLDGWFWQRDAFCAQQALPMRHAPAIHIARTRPCAISNKLDNLSWQVRYLWTRLRIQEVHRTELNLSGLRQTGDV